MESHWIRLTPEYKLCHSDDTSLIFCNTLVAFRRNPLPDINLILWDYQDKHGRIGLKRIFYRDPAGNYYQATVEAGWVINLERCSFSQRTFLNGLVLANLQVLGSPLKHKGGSRDGKAIVC